MKYIAKVFVYENEDQKIHNLEATGEFATLKEARHFVENIWSDRKNRRYVIKVVDLED